MQCNCRDWVLCIAPESMVRVFLEIICQNKARNKLPKKSTEKKTHTQSNNYHAVKIDMYHRVFKILFIHMLVVTSRMTFLLPFFFKRQIINK